MSPVVAPHPAGGARRALARVRGAVQHRLTAATSQGGGRLQEFRHRRRARAALAAPDSGALARVGVLTRRTLGVGMLLALHATGRVLSWVDAAKRWRGR